MHRATVRDLASMLGMGRVLRHSSSVAESRRPSDPRRVARAAILVARALAPETGAVTDAIRLLPYPDLIDQNEASSRLAGMRKPLECESRVRNGILELRCSRLTRANAGRRRIRQAVLDAAGGVLSSEEREAVLRSPSRSLLLVGIDESMMLTVSEYEQLERDYVFPGDFLMAGGAPGEFGYRDSEAAVARYYRASRMEAAGRP